MGLMMTRGSDPAEGKRARGADHLEEPRGILLSRCHRRGGGRGAEGSCGGGSLGPRTRDSDARPWRTSYGLLYTEGADLDDEQEL